MWKLTYHEQGIPETSSNVNINVTDISATIVSLKSAAHLQRPVSISYLYAVIYNLFIYFQII
jgi:hypothetical protein